MSISQTNGNPVTQNSTNNNSNSIMRVGNLKNPKPKVNKSSAYCIDGKETDKIYQEQPYPNLNDEPIGYLITKKISNQTSDVFSTSQSHSIKTNNSPKNNNVTIKNVNNFITAYYENGKRTELSDDFEKRYDLICKDVPDQSNINGSSRKKNTDPYGDTEVKLPPRYGLENLDWITRGYPVKKIDNIYGEDYRSINNKAYGTFNIHLFYTDKPTNIFYPGTGWWNSVQGGGHRCESSEFRVHLIAISSENRQYVSPGFTVNFNSTQNEMSSKHLIQNPSIYDRTHYFSQSLPKGWGEQWVLSQIPGYGLHPLECAVSAALVIIPINGTLHAPRLVAYVTYSDELVAIPPTRIIPTCSPGTSFNDIPSNQILRAHYYFDKNKKISTPLFITKPLGIYNPDYTDCDFGAELEETAQTACQSVLINNQTIPNWLPCDRFNITIDGFKPLSSSSQDLQLVSFLNSKQFDIEIDSAGNGTHSEQFSIPNGNGTSRFYSITASASLKNDNWQVGVSVVDEAYYDAGCGNVRNVASSVKVSKTINSIADSNSFFSTHPTTVTNTTYKCYGDTYPIEPILDTSETTISIS